jgi:DNA-binding transcriptional MerR regulator
LRTKEIIEMTGVNRETLRFYEANGLLPKINRKDSGYRDYPEQTIARLEFITKAKSAGFTLKEIKSLLDLQQKKGPCRSVRDTAKNKRQEIALKIQALKEMDTALRKFILECEKDGESSLSRSCHFLFDEL